MKWPLFNLFRSRRAELSEELQAHLEMAISERVERGASPESARVAVLREMGNLTLVREVTSEQWDGQWVDAIARDLRYALRQFRKSPGLALTVVTMLALGIGANAALFTVFEQVVLATLPVRDPGQLVLLKHQGGSEEGSWSTWGDQDLYFSYPAYLALRDHNHSLEGLAASAFSSVNLTTEETAFSGTAEYVTGNYFSVLGLRTVLGRTIEEADDHPHGGNPVAVLGEDFWRAHYGSDESILNRTLRVNGVLFTIVGVVPYRGLTGEYVPSVFLPIAMQHTVMAGRDLNHDRLTDMLFYWITPVGRLKPGVRRTAAQADLDTIWRNWHRSVKPLLHQGGDFDKQFTRTQLSLVDGSHGLNLLEGLLGGPVRVLFLMVAVILAIACCNIASLLLIKASTRQRELAVQHALGASRWQLCRQALTEGLLLGCIGAAAGIVIGMVTFRVAAGTIPESSVLKTAISRHLDWRVLLFALLLGLGTSILFSLGPALTSLHVDPLGALHKQSNRATEGGTPWHGILVAGEIALCLALLVCAGLVAQALYGLRLTNPGFAISQRFTFTVDASALARRTEQTRNEYNAIEAALRRLPGVHNVGYASMPLLGDDEGGSYITVGGRPGKAPRALVDFDWITPGFLPTNQIEMLAGRLFTAQDADHSQKVAIVDEDFVRQFFDGDTTAAIGTLVGFSAGDQTRTDIQIVGVVPQIHAVSLSHKATAPMMYMPYAQGWARAQSHPATFYIRSTAPQEMLKPLMRDVVHQIDRDLPMVAFGTMQQTLDDSIFQQRMMAALACAMAALALVMSAIGLYAVLSHAVARRTPEIGIRIALGADRASVMSLVATRLLVLIAVGLAVGLPSAWAASRILKSFTDVGGSPAAFLLAGALVIVAACGLAAVVPLQRALSVDPMQILRTE